MKDVQTAESPCMVSNGIIGHTHTPNTRSECLIIGRKGSSGKVVHSGNPCFAIDTTFFVDCCGTSSNIRWLYYLLTFLELESLAGDVGVPGLNRETLTGKHALSLQFMNRQPSSGT